MQTDEAKRARQREHVKNSYYRKQVFTTWYLRSLTCLWIPSRFFFVQNLLSVLRSEASELELKYACTLQRKQQQMAWRDVAGALGCDEGHSASEELVEQYMQLSMKKQQLDQENKDLKLMRAMFTKFQLKTEHLLEITPQVTLEPPLIAIAEEILDPLTIAECHQLAFKAFQEIASFMEHNSYLTTGLELFGWREQRREAPDHVKFTLKKRFIGYSPLEMSLRAWRVVSSPRGLAGLYSSTMRLSLKVLQVVDDYNVIMHRVMTSAGTMRTVESLFLISRFQIDTGYAILFRSIDRNRLRKRCEDEMVEIRGEGRQDKWLDMFAWTLYEEELGNDNAVTYSYGGIVHGTEAVATRVWMFEVLSLALRWEHKVVGPQRLIK